MDFNNALSQVCHEVELILNENENLITWDLENEIKKFMVSGASLENFFCDQEQLENMYVYEMFADNLNIPDNKKKIMLKLWIDALKTYADIDIKTSLAY